MRKLWPIALFDFESMFEAEFAEPLAEEAMGISDQKWKEWESKFIAGNRAAAREVFAIGSLLGFEFRWLSDQRVA